MGNKFSLKSILIAAAALIGCIGVFLPWGVVKVLFISESVAGTAGDGWLSFGALIIAAAIAMAFIKKEKFPVGGQIAITAFGVAAGVIALIKMFDINGIGLGASAGFGIYYTIIFSVIVAVLPWVPINKTLGK